MNRAFVAINIILTFTLVLLAQKSEDGPYHAVGHVSTPKVKVHWNVYHDYAQISSILKELAKAYPKYCKLESLGKSYGGKDLWMIKVTDYESGPLDEKTGYWIDGGIHANELQTPEVVLYTAWYLLEMKGKNKFIDQLLKDRVFYLLPIFSPDSRDAHIYRANNTHSPRSGQRPVDDDKDGLVNEDGYDDLDGDGHIVMMRIKDPNGAFKVDPEDPQKMLRVKGKEKGDYRILGQEGIDNDGDGRVNEDGDGFYDPNRNFAWGWKSSYIQRGSSFYPFSNKENRAVGDYIMARPHIAGLQTYHNTGGMLLVGPGSKERPYEASDNRLLEEMSRFGERLLPGYKHKVIYKDLYAAYGTEIDWAYGMLGITAYNNELFSSYNYFHNKELKGWFGHTDEMHHFNQHILFGDGWVDWHEVDHPQFGKVEVGGFKKNWGRQAPSFMLQEECHRNMAFTFYHADQMPKVEISDVKVEKQAASTWLVTAVIKNEKLLPTHLAVDLKQKITPPVTFEVQAKDLKVVYGMQSNDVFFRGAKEQKHKPEKIKIKNLPGGSVLYVRWLIQAEGRLNLKLKAIKGGTDRREIELK